jgi:mRNA-degrading endonuclease RelE of RelBE toxin-antitoxin system
MGRGEGPDSSVIGRAPREVRLLRRAERDLLALGDADRGLVVKAIDALERDALPRGAAAIPTRVDGHLLLRAGRFRVIYRLRDRALTVVAITST